MCTDGHDERDVRSFRLADSKGAGLVAYLQRQVLADELCGNMRTHLARDNFTDELVGYFTLKAGLVSVNEERDGDNVELDTVRGLSLLTSPWRAA